MNNINNIAKTHFKWLESMSWNSSTHLEAAVMISSEVGETIYEESVKNLENLSEEMADIILRTIGLTQRFNIDLEFHIHNSPIINICRQSQVDENELAQKASLLITSVINLSKIYKIDLESVIIKKINKNLLKGKNGRVK